MGQSATGVAAVAERDVTMLPGRTVTSVDAAARRVICADGESLCYGSLIWATGGAPRRLPCPGGDRAHTIRCRADVDRLKAQLRRKRHHGFLCVRIVARDRHHELPAGIFRVRHVVRAGGVERLHDACAFRKPRDRLARRV